MMWRVGMKMEMKNIADMKQWTWKKIICKPVIKAHAFMAQPFF